MTQPVVIVYTRQGCHLCDDAIELLRRHGVNPQAVDIDVESKTRPELLEMYDQCVPVVTIDGKIRFRSRVNEVLLTRLLTRN